MRSKIFVQWKRNDINEVWKFGDGSVVSFELLISWISNYSEHDIRSMRVSISEKFFGYEHIAGDLNFCHRKSKMPYDVILNKLTLIKDTQSENIATIASFKRLNAEKKI